MIESVAMSKLAPSSSTIEAPLPIKVASSNLNEETTISFPVIVDRPTRVNNDTNASSRKGAWSREEDIELQAAVQKWGEGNWTEMAARDDFTLNRTAAQLSKVIFLTLNYLCSKVLFYFTYYIGLIYTKYCLQRWRILRNKAGTN